MFGSQRHKLKPTWRFKAAGVLWRVVPTPSGNLIGEARNLQEKRVGFFCLNQKTGKVLWEEKTFGEQWWIGIEALVADTLFLHRYTTPELPEHQGLIAVDVQSGNELWRNNDVRFVAAQGERVRVLRRGREGGETVHLECRTGNIVEGTADPATEAPSSQSTFPELVFDVFASDSPNSQTIRKHCDERRLVGPVEYLATLRYLILCYHERKDTSSHDQLILDTIVKILDREDGTVRFAETIHQNASAVVPENFFVENHMLVFIHERSTLSAIELD